MATHKQIESVAHLLWEEVKAMPREEMCPKVEYWVVEPGNIVGRVVAYDRLLILYWVNMNLITHSSLSPAAK